MASSGESAAPQSTQPVWRPEGWKSSFDKAGPEHIMAALLGATGALRGYGLIEDDEAAQLAQVCMCCSVQEALLLSAALAAHDDTEQGHADFLAMLRTVANKPVPVGSTVGPGLDGPLPPTMPVGSPHGGGFAGNDL